MTGGVKTGSVPLSWEIAFVLSALIDGGELGGQQLPVNIIITNITVKVWFSKSVPEINLFLLHMTVASQ